ncbi:MAG: hypothetical protein PT977_05535 [Acidobacteriota bacterium]|nr:hypothetical protein [Acidobacteriota bacterium]
MACWATVALLAFLAAGAQGAEILLPAIAARVEGANSAIWASEVRVTNFSSAPKTFRIVDWIGTPGWIPSAYSIPPGATTSISGWAIYVGSRANERSSSPNPFGAAVADVEDGLSVQTAILTGNPRGEYGTVGDFARCSQWTGGWVYDVGGVFYPDGTVTGDDGCNQGAGPVIDNDSSFFPAGTSILLPWLHTDSKRRVNISLVNPDAVAATVTLSLFPADGASPVVSSFTVEARTVLQINDIFAPRYFGTVRTRNEALKAAAARATIVSTTRLYPLAYVISNQNNTVSISLPR